MEKTGLKSRLSGYWRILIKSIRCNGLLRGLLILLIFDSINISYFIIFLDNPNIEVSSDIKDIIAILTSSIISIGFLYYIGYIIALRLKENPYVAKPNQSLQYFITFNGSMLFLSIFLPFLGLYLIDLGQLYIRVYILILINIASVVGIAFLNTWITAPSIPEVSTITLITNAVDKTSTEGLRLASLENEDYIFYDDNGNQYIIPRAQVKSIIIPKAIKPKKK